MGAATGTELLDQPLEVDAEVARPRGGSQRRINPGLLSAPTVFDACAGHHPPFSTSPSPPRRPFGTSAPPPSYRALRQLDDEERARCAARRHETWFRVLAVAVAVLVLTACGTADRTSDENDIASYGSRCCGSVSDTASEATVEGDKTVQAVQQRLEGHVPVAPAGQVLTLAGDAAPGRARVGFAVNGKVDHDGPGGITVTLRMCVQDSMAPPPDASTTIEDTDCSTLVPKADSVVTSRP